MLRRRCDGRHPPRAGVAWYNRSMPIGTLPISARDLEEWIAAWIVRRGGGSGPTGAPTREDGEPTREIDPRARFTSLGIDSRAATELCVELSALLGRQLALTLVWEHPT